MAHVHEKIDFTTSVYVVYAGKVLLHVHKRAGIWLPPGGHIELNEGPIEAALREVKEEAGLDVELVGNKMSDYKPHPMRWEILPPKFINRHYYDEAKTHEHIDLVYFGTTRNPDFTAEENREMRWVSREDIEKGTIPLNDDIRTYALAALDELE